MTRTIYLSMGTNVGDRLRNIRLALEALRQKVAVTAVSSVYETSPVGVTDQPTFLNVALAATTDLEPEELLTLVRAVEREVGRTPTYRWGPRVIDIDILIVDDLVYRSESLTIPHVEMANRAFVLVPLAEIAPNVMHPVLQIPMRDLCARPIADQQVSRLGDVSL
jgi:2-amino-4-hydroxy-6-hydroxymethyldihydropteridine diphosphokinase